MDQALGVLDIVVPRLVDGVEPFGVLDILQVEHQVLRPVELADKGELVLHQDLPAVQFVPQHPVVIGGRLFHQAEGKGPGVHQALGQEIVDPEFRRLLFFLVRLRGFPWQQGGQFFLNPAAGGHFPGDHHFIGGDHQVGPVFLGGIHQMFGVIGVQIVVAVHELDIFAPCQLQAQVPGVGHPGIFLVHQDNPGVHLPVHLADLEADVLGAVVQNDDLDVPMGLGPDALNAAGNVILGIVNRQNDADQWLFLGRHQRTPSLLVVGSAPVGCQEVLSCFFRLRSVHRTPACGQGSSGTVRIILPGGLTAVWWSRWILPGPCWTGTPKTPGTICT